MPTSLRILRKASDLRQPLTLVAVLIVVVTLSNLSWADSCPAAVTLSLSAEFSCTIPEQAPEAGFTATLTGLSFTAQTQGVVLLYDDSTHTLLSDVVIFTNVGGVSTVTFVSDTDGIPLSAEGLPILGQFTEGHNSGFISLELGNGKYLHATVCSDVGETSSCSGASDSISLEVYTAVPEPGTFLMLGSGLLGSGALRLSAASWRRRLLRRT